MKSNPNESLLAQWFRRVWNEGDASAIEELLAANATSHGLRATIHGREAWREQFYEPMRAAFSNIHVELVDEGVAAGGSMIFGRLAATVVPNTTRQSATMNGMCQMRIADGKIAEAWDTWDFLGLLESMKLLPAGSFGQAITGVLERHPMA
jgi:predicted SnoaL-like aldol condensation-catalyzing enzyme